MKALFTFFFFLFLWGCGSGNKSTEANSNSEPTSNKPPTMYYTILRVDDHDSFKNLDILIDSSKVDKEDILMAAKMCKTVECTGTPCNVITIWNSKSALELWQNKNEDPAWRKKNWPFMCEHDVAEYNVSVGEVNLYPFMDSEYHRWGGKKQRPKPSSFDL